MAVSGWVGYAMTSAEHTPTMDCPPGYMARQGVNIPTFTRRTLDESKVPRDRTTRSSSKDAPTSTSASSSDPVPHMLSMVEKYSANFPTRESKASTHAATSSHADGEYILLTGSTGTLGTYLLAALIQEPRVRKVFAFNRPSKSGKSILERQRAALVDRGLPSELASHEKVVLLEGTTSLPRLGLSDSVYEAIRATLTGVIHAAWPLNFNMPVLSFEPYIAGSRNLVDLALTSAKEVQFMFTSSLGSVLNWNGDEPVPERMYDAATAGTGYGQGKWVVDQILARAANERDLRTTTFRIGQLAGSTVNGAWNATDWVSRIIQTSYKMGKLFLVDEAYPISWLPVDAAASAIIEALRQPVRGSRVLTVAHPTPSPWNRIMRYIGEYIIRSGRSVQYLPCDTWLHELESLSSTPSASSTYSSLKLLDFFRGCNERQKSGNTEAMGMPKLATSEICKVSRTLADMPMLSVADVERWMAYWEKDGMFEQTEYIEATRAKL